MIILLILQPPVKLIFLTPGILKRTCLQALIAFLLICSYNVPQLHFLSAYTYQLHDKSSCISWLPEEGADCFYPQTGQNRYASSRFRPISLLSCIPKAYEYMRTAWKCSFLPIRLLLLYYSCSTQHQLCRESELFHEGILKKLKTDVAFIDIPKDFDRVCYFGVIYKLIMLKNPNPSAHFYFLKLI